MHTETHAGGGGAGRTGRPARLGTVVHVTADLQGRVLATPVAEALEAAQAHARAEERSDRWLLCGLHTCGDLACTTLRLGRHRHALSPCLSVSLRAGHASRWEGLA
jgi:hypothetical protein